jgi:hypothetical protein
LLIDLAGGNLESIEIKFEAGKKNARFHVGVLVRLQDVSAIAKNKVGNSRNETFLIGTGNQERGSFRHGLGF